MKQRDQFLYQTIAGPAHAEIREKASKFLGFAFSVNSLDEIRTHLEDLQKIHPKANHHCYAWRIGFDGTQYRAQDDGEPAGTAGKPILGQIDSFELSQVLIVVVRYFGGTKLGTTGLIQAYKATAQAVLEQAQIVSKAFTKNIQIRVPIEFSGDAGHLAHQFQAENIKTEYTDDVSMEFELPLSVIDEFTIKLKAIVGKITLDEAKTKEKIAGLIIDIKP